MMISVLETEVLERAQVIGQCRRHQLEQLGLYYNKYLPTPPIIVAHGLRDTGKLETILTVLDGAQTNYALVKSRECLSQRHLLAKVFAACVRTLKRELEIEKFDRVDSINALSVNLQKLFKNSRQKFVLVIDSVDKQRGSSHTLLPALARMGDIVPALSIILTTSSPRQLNLQRSGVPYVSFPPFTRNEAIQIVLSKHSTLRPEHLPDDLPPVDDSLLSDIHASFVNAVYDTLTVHTSLTSIPTFQRTCDKLWPRFIWPLLSNEPLPSRNNFGTSKVRWDFARLLTRNRSLFQSTGEKALTEKLSSKSNEPWTFDQLIEQYQTKKLEQLQPNSLPPLASASVFSSSKPQNGLGSGNTVPSTVSLLKFFSTLLLLSCYLASHTPAKHDIVLFSRLSSSSSHKKRYLSSALNKNRTPKKQRVRKTPTKSDVSSAMEIDEQDIDNAAQTTPSKTPNRQVINAEAKGTPVEKEKTHKSSRLQFEKTSSIPKPFALERVIAIVRAVHPDGLARTKGAADKVYAEMVELERLRLVVRLGTGANAGASAASAINTTSSTDGGGSKGTDDGILEEKWRVNASRDIIIDMGRRWGIGLEGWEID